MSRVRSLGAMPTRVRALALWAAVVATIVGAGVIAQQQRDDTQPAAVRVEPVRSAVLMCPEPGGQADDGVRITAAVIPGQPGQDESGAASLRTLPGKNEASREIEVPGGQAQINAFGERRPPIVAVGTGSLAPGLVADQWGRDPRGRGRGLASTACAPASSQSWFVGGGAIAGRQTRIVLVNPDETAAAVDLVIHGPEGVIDAPGGRGLVVAPLDRLVVRLDTLVPGVRATAVHVIARTGRIGAAVDDDQMTGLDSVGSDWIPVAAPPSTSVYVPGVLPGAGARVLSIVAPDADATVSITVITADGTFAPAERATVRVSAQAVATLDLAPVIGGVPATIKLTSDTPIVAGMRQFFGGRRVQNETSFTAGRQPFTGPAAVTGLPVRSRTDVRLAITAPDGPAEIDVTVLPFAGGTEAAVAVAPRRVTIDAGTVRFIRIPAPAGVDWYTAVVTPIEGSVLVAHRVRERSTFGDLITGYPWSPLRIEVPVPSVAADPGITVR